jgi:hypothetical protein
MDQCNTCPLLCSPPTLAQRLGNRYGSKLMLILVLPQQTVPGIGVCSNEFVLLVDNVLWDYMIKIKIIK